MKKSIALLVAVGALLTAGAAQAQDAFATQGTMAFSADRLFGFYGYKATWDVPGAAGSNEYSHSGSQLNLLWGNNGVLSEETPINPMTTPRLSFDYFVIQGLSVGGSIGYARTTGGWKHESGPAGSQLRPSYDTPTYSMFAFSPRVGYAYMFSDIVGIWPRGGLTYASFNAEAETGDPDEASRSMWTLDIEAMFVIVPKEHFAFVVGPVIDLGIAGSWKEKDGASGLSVDGDAKLHTYGLAAGILGYF